MFNRPIGSTASLLLIPLLLLLAACSSPPEEEEAAAWETEGIRLAVDAGTDDRSVAVSVTTNFPDETRLHISLYAGQRSIHSESVRVRDGLAQLSLGPFPGGLAAGDYRVAAVFPPRGQDAAVSAIFGSQGQNLTEFELAEGRLAEGTLEQTVVENDTDVRVAADSALAQSAAEEKERLTAIIAGMTSLFDDLQAEVERQQNQGYDADAWSVWIEAWRVERDDFASEYGVRQSPGPGSFQQAALHLQDAFEALSSLANQYESELRGGVADVDEPRTSYRTDLDRAQRLLDRDGFTGPQDNGNQQED